MSAGEGTDFFVALVEHKLREGKGAQMHARLSELLANARRGIALRERYAPKTGRAFLKQGRGRG